MTYDDDDAGAALPGGAPPPGARPPRPRASLVAAFACLATERLGRQLGSPLAVIAATGDPAAHAAGLALRWHAAWAPLQGWPLDFDEGLTGPWDVNYAHLPFDPRWMGRAALPEGVRLEGGCLAVDVPRGCGAGDLGPMLAMALAGRGYAAAAGRPSGVRRRAASGRPLVLPARYALAGPGAFGRFRLVEDLYAFRPRDLPAVAAAAAMASSGLALRALLSPEGGLDR